ncbi:MAG: hypothetical protein JWP63_5251 [Candidatus Solibacter sp.]|nr:hypothetical protein [Candidatus Solibacter sp.]
MNITTTIPSRRRAVSLSLLAQLIATAFVLIQGIFLVPLYLRFIALPLYGAWLASTQVVGWVTLLDPGTDEVTRQRAAHAYGRGDLEQVGGLIGSGLAVNLVVALCVTAVSLVLCRLLPWWFGIDGLNGRQLVVASSILALASGITVVAYITGSSLQALQCTGVYGIVLILGNAAGLALNLKLLYAGWGLSAISAGLLLKALVWTMGWGCTLVWQCRFRKGSPIRLAFSFHEARTLIRLACHMLVSKLASILQTSSDSVLAGTILGPSQTARLVLTGRIIDSARLLPDKIGAAMQPALSNLAGEGDSRKSLKISVRFLTIASLIAAPLIGTAVVLNRDVVGLWVGPSLFGGQPLSSLLGISAMLTLLTTAAYHVLFANGLIETTSKIALMAGLLKVALLAILLPRIGLIAAPLTGILAILLITGPRFLRAFTTIFGAHSEPKVKVLARVLSGPLICLILALALTNTPTARTWPDVAIKGVLVLIFLSATLIVLPSARAEVSSAWTAAWGRAKGLHREYV